MHEQGLPRHALVLIAIAVALLWILLLLGVLAMLFLGTTGAGLGLSGIVSSLGGDSPVGASILAQQAITLLTFVAIWGLGSAVLWFSLVSRHDLARRSALWLLCALVVLTIFGAVASAAPIVEMGGSVWSALPVLVTRLPVLLVEIALLLCAAVYLRKPPDSIF